MRKKLAGIHLLAPLSETDIVNYSRNLDRELIVNSTIVTDAIVDTVEKTNYIVTFEYDTTLDGGTNHIRRSIPTLELLSYTGENMSGAHWVNVEDMDYHYITSGTSSQQAFEELDEQLSKVCYLKHLVDGVGDGSLISSNDNKTPLSTVDNSEYAFVLGNIHTLTASNFGVILGGHDSNILSSLHASILNGYNNTIHNSYDSLINGGRHNIIGVDTRSTFILSGMYNKIEDATDCGIISGHNNYIYGSDNSYGSVVISSAYGYIDSSEFSIISNTSNSYITGGKYDEISISSYIEIFNSTSSSVSTSTNHTISNSTFANVIGSNVTTPLLNIYRSTLSSISNSTDACIWNSINSSILNSLSASIGYEVEAPTTTSTAKAADHLVVADVTGFIVGQSVTLYGAEFTTYKNEYIIYDIDVTNKLIYFCDGNNNTIPFDINNVTAIIVKVVSSHKLTYTILSNTEDTIVLNDYIIIKSSIDRYITIDGIKYKYNAIIASGTSESVNTIKLVNYGTSDVVLFTPNELEGKILRNYEYSNVSYNTSIISSNNSNMSYTLGSVILAGYENYCTNGSYQLIHSSINSKTSFASTASIGSSNKSELSHVSNTAILGGLQHYISSATNCIILGGDHNYIISGSENGIFASNYGYITSSNSSVILGGEHNTINKFLNVSIISGKSISAWRSNVLMTPSIALTDRTFELMGKTPKENQTLVVTSVTNNVATLDWGYAGGTGILSYDYSIYGSSTFLIGSRLEDSGTKYINICDPNDALTYDNFCVGLCKDGYYQTDNHTNNGYSHIISGTIGSGGVIDREGLYIEPNYVYSITYECQHIGWDGYTGYENSAWPTFSNLSISEQTTITGNVDGTVDLKNSSSVNTIRLDDNARVTSNNVVTYTSSDTSDTGAKSMITLYNKNTRNVTFGINKLYQSMKYVGQIPTPYFIDSNGNVWIEFKFPYKALPVVGSKIGFWKDTYIDTANQYTVNEIGGINNSIRISLNGTPNASGTGYVIFDDMVLPPLQINVKLHVTKVSKALIDIIKGM